VSVSVLRDLTLRMRPPRAVFVRWPFGHALGEPCNRAQQRTIIHAALTTLYQASPGALIELPYRWRRERYGEPASWDLGPPTT
jgi:D-proline reductase (dithiol) PrdB